MWIAFDDDAHTLVDCRGGVIRTGMAEPFDDISQLIGDPDESSTPPATQYLDVMGTGQVCRVLFASEADLTSFASALENGLAGGAALLRVGGSGPTYLSVQISPPRVIIDEDCYVNVAFQEPIEVTVQDRRPVRVEFVIRRPPARIGSPHSGR